MSRHGYTDAPMYDPVGALYERALFNALHGKAGQKFLRELIDALDAMPEKRLIEGELIDRVEVCALGVLGMRRGLDMTELDPLDYDGIADALDIKPILAREAMFENDEFGNTPEARWAHMRAWAARNLISGSAQPGSAR